MDKETDMNNENKTYTQPDFRPLLQRYFEGDASPSETAVLTEMAKTAEKEGFQGLTADTADTLRMILRLDRMAETVIVPPTLEGNLDRHISRLARSGARKRMRRWIAGAAAVAAIAFTAAWLPRDNSNLTDSLAENDTRLLPELTLEIPAEKELAEVSERQAESTVSKEAPAVQAPRRLAVKPRSSQKPPMASASEPSEETLIPSLSQSAPTTPPSLQLAVVNLEPTLSAATVSTGDLLAQPLSTLSQAIDNVYQSLETVHRVFSGVGNTMDTAVEGLTMVTDAPLHAI